MNAACRVVTVLIVVALLASHFVTTPITLDPLSRLFVHPRFYNITRTSTAQVAAPAARPVQRPIANPRAVDAARPIAGKVERKASSPSSVRKAIADAKRGANAVEPVPPSTKQTRLQKKVDAEESRVILDDDEDGDEYYDDIHSEGIDWDSDDDELDADAVHKLGFEDEDEEGDAYDADDQDEDDEDDHDDTHHALNDPEIMHLLNEELGEDDEADEADVADAGMDAESRRALAFKPAAKQSVPDASVQKQVQQKAGKGADDAADLILKGLSVEFPVAAPDSAEDIPGAEVVTELHGEAAHAEGFPSLDDEIDGLVSGQAVLTEDDATNGEYTDADAQDGEAQDYDGVESESVRSREDAIEQAAAGAAGASGIASFDEEDMRDFVPFENEEGDQKVAGLAAAAAADVGNKGDDELGEEVLAVDEIVRGFAAMQGEQQMRIDDESDDRELVEQGVIVEDLSSEDGGKSVY